jgi:hypothetical protein
MRVGLVGLGALPGCFVITPNDVFEHDALSGDWEGEWLSEDGDESCGVEVTFGRADWEGSVEVWGEWAEADLNGARRGDELVMAFYGENFEMEMEAKLELIDRIDGDCLLSLADLEIPCTFNLRPL